MKKSVFFSARFSLFCAVACVFFLTTGSFAAEPIKMKIGLSNDPGSPRVRGAELFGKLIRRGRTARSK